MKNTTVPLSLTMFLLHSEGVQLRIWYEALMNISLLFLLVPISHALSSCAGSSVRSALCGKSAMEQQARTLIPGDHGNTSIPYVKWWRATCPYIMSMGNMWLDSTGWWVLTTGRVCYVVNKVLIVAHKHNWYLRNARLFDHLDEFAYFKEWTVNQ